VLLIYIFHLKSTFTSMYHQPYLSISCTSYWSSSVVAVLRVWRAVAVEDDGRRVCLFVLVIIAAIVMIRKKRASHGTYRPSHQELESSRTDFESTLKVPPEERLIWAIVVPSYFNCSPWCNGYNRFNHIL